jgi:hypothetical protein
VILLRIIHRDHDLRSKTAQRGQKKKDDKKYLFHCKIPYYKDTKKGVKYCVLRFFKVVSFPAGIRGLTFMLVQRLILYLLIACPLALYCQLPIMYGPFYKQVRTMPPKFKKVEGSDSKYINQTDYKLSYVILNKNGSFVYYSSSAVAFDLCLGNYRRDKDYLFFTWDSIKTINAVGDSTFYKKYFPKNKPTSFMIEKTQYILSKDKNILKLPNRFGVVELFFNPNQLFTHGLIVDSLSNWDNPIIQDTKHRKLILNRRKKRNTSLPLDSLWGFRYALNDAGYIYRFTTSDSTYPVARILQGTKGMIIYEAGWHKNRYLYLSKDAGSKMYSLTLANLKILYKDDPVFLKQAEEKFYHKWTGPNDTSISDNGKYMILELYEKYRDSKGN